MSILPNVIGRFEIEMLQHDALKTKIQIFYLKTRYDKSRVDEVGPDRACAEWLIRCGAGVKWSKDSEWFRDYNSLPAGNFRALKIVEIDGTDSAVMHIGFKHLRNEFNLLKSIHDFIQNLLESNYCLIFRRSSALSESRVS